ncbi:MAG: hypothetical protein J5813_03640 [Candidatus Methanomethylophilaceae archaeon]|nr:hypothetical protein [Candidatus Methanomethylophilaceae archaeon]
MISIRIGDCDIDIIPIIKGLVSEREKVIEALSKKEYETAGVSWGIEEIEAVRKRDEITGDNETNDIDIIYLYKLKEFGDVDMPDPAFTYVVDEFSKKGISVIPLDMADQEFAEAYCNEISTLDFLRENKIVKKMMKKEFTASSPEEFMTEWDSLINEVKGYRKMNKVKERFVAEQIMDIAKYRKNALILVEYERCDGILSIIKGEE